MCARVVKKARWWVRWSTCSSTRLSSTGSVTTAHRGGREECSHHELARSCARDEHEVDGSTETVFDDVEHAIDRRDEVAAKSNLAVKTAGSTP